MAKKKKRDTEALNLVSPKGEAAYAYLFKPCTLFNKEEFKLTLVLPLADPETKAYLKKIEAFAKENAPGPGRPFKVDKEAGTASIKFHTKNAPMVVDAKKVAITDDIRLGNGSIVRVAGVFLPFDGFGGGLTAYLNKVQVVDLKEYTPDAAEFDEEEGYTAGASGGKADDIDDDDFGGDDDAPEEGDEDGEDFPF